MFDRYHQDSIKGHTRIVRASGVTRRFHLRLATELPSAVAEGRSDGHAKQDATYRPYSQSLQEDPIVSRQKLVVTGLNDTPIQIHNGVVTELILLKTSHEEADVIMINQLLWVVTTSSTTKSVKVICDDTDVFALLIHYVHTENIENTIIMQATKNGHPIIDIHEVIEKMIAEKLDTALILQVHALSGCDTVAAYYRKGKKNSTKGS